MRTIPYRAVLLMLDEAGCADAEEIVLIHRLLMQFGVSIRIATADDDIKLKAAEIRDFKPKLVLLHGCRRARTGLSELIAVLSGDPNPLVVALINDETEREQTLRLGADEAFLTSLHMHATCEHLGRLIGVSAGARSKAAATLREELSVRPHGVDLASLAQEHPPLPCTRQNKSGQYAIDVPERNAELDGRDDEETGMARCGTNSCASSTWYLVGNSRFLLTPQKILFSLTPYEHKALLLMLNSDTGHVSQQSWQSAAGTENSSTSLALVISRLKRKLRRSGHQLPILTERGVGYSFEPFNALKHAPSFEPASA